MRSFLRRAGAPRQRSTRRKRDSACAISCYLPFGIVCNCTRVNNCRLLAFCRVFQPIRACVIAYNLPFAVLCSCPRVHNCILIAFCRVLQLSARTHLHVTCLLPCFAAVCACPVAYCLSVAVVCSCPRVHNCMLLSFCRGLQLYARAQLHVTCLLPCFSAVGVWTIASYLPFAVFFSCRRVNNCKLLAFCRVLQLYARAQLHVTCLLLCFAAVRACTIACYLPFAVFCSCPRVPCCIMVAFRRYLLCT